VPLYGQSNRFPVTRPSVTYRTGETLPPCLLGEVFLKTNEPPGRRFYYCEDGVFRPANTSVLPQAVSQAFANAMTALILHNFSAIPVATRCTDLQNNEVEPDKVSYPDSNSALVTFARPQTGTCQVSALVTPQTSTFSPAPYIVNFTTQTSVLVGSLAHGRNAANLDVDCDTGSPTYAPIEHDRVARDSSNNITILFARPQTGRCLIR
jgi:hypothetical protein